MDVPVAAAGSPRCRPPPTTNAARSSSTSPSSGPSWRAPEPPCRSRAALTALGADDDLIDGWLADPADGALADEVRARFEGVPATYGVVVDTAGMDAAQVYLAASRAAHELTVVV